VKGMRLGLIDVFYLKFKTLLHYAPPENMGFEKSYLEIEKLKLKKLFYGHRKDKDKTNF